MIKTLKKLKRINSQLAAAKSELENIKQWRPECCKIGEKEAKITKHIHWIGELEESKFKILEQLEADIQIEKELLSQIEISQ